MTPTPQPTKTPTLTPTPSPLEPSAIFDKVSPSVAFIDVSIATGSGLLIEGGYIVTNAHVVWPFDKARVVFPDGTEHTDVPVVNWDMMADLAVLGPIETDLPPLALVDGESSIIGSDVFLIGYPGEVEEFPQPTITRGLISRKREWTPIDLTYFQTDAMIAGGQSGGVFLSEFGEVIGISGFTFSEADFGLVASAIDLLPRIRGLIENKEDVNGLGDRRLTFTDIKNGALVTLRNEWDQEAFIINEPVGTEVEIEISAENDTDLTVFDSAGRFVTYVDNTTAGTEWDSFEIEMEGPYFLLVTQYNDLADRFGIDSSHNLFAYRDPDNGKTLERGETISAMLDYPGDIDYYSIALEAGETINIIVDSIFIDPYLIVGQRGASGNQLVYDYDTAGGVFGTNAELTYQAPHRGRFLIIVESAYGQEVGGYFITVDEPSAGAPTPVAPPPPPTPIVSEFGEMALYQSEVFPFSIQYPVDWTEDGDAGALAAVCNFVTTCRIGENGLLAIAEEDLSVLGIQTYSLEEYVDLILKNAESASVNEFISRETISLAHGEEAQIVVIDILNGTFKTIRFTTLHKGIAFGATYMMTGDVYEEYLPIIEYSFSTFQVVESEE